MRLRDRSPPHPTRSPKAIPAFGDKPGCAFLCAKRALRRACSRICSCSQGSAGHQRLTHIFGGDHPGQSPIPSYGQRRGKASPEPLIRRLERLGRAFPWRRSPASTGSLPTRYWPPEPSLRSSGQEDEAFVPAVLLWSSKASEWRPAVPAVALVDLFAGIAGGFDRDDGQIVGQGRSAGKLRQGIVY